MQEAVTEAVQAAVDEGMKFDLRANLYTLIAITGWLSAIACLSHPVVHNMFCCGLRMHRRPSTTTPHHTAVLHQQGISAMHACSTPPSLPHNKTQLVMLQVWSCTGEASGQPGTALIPGVTFSFMQSPLLSVSHTSGQCCVPCFCPGTTSLGSA